MQFYVNQYCNKKSYVTKYKELTERLGANFILCYKTEDARGAHQ